MTTDGIRVVEPETVPAEHDVRVTVVSSGICGSDLHMASFGPSWAILGHEFSGTLDDGTPVAVLPVVRCGTCDRCLAGAEQQCRNSLSAMYGVSLDGGLADEAWVNPACATPLPDGVALDHAHLVEPIAVALHGINRAGVVHGMRVLVLGPGPSASAPWPLPGTSAPTSTSRDIGRTASPWASASAPRRRWVPTTTWCSTPPAPRAHSTVRSNWLGRVEPSRSLAPTGTRSSWDCPSR